MPLRRSAIAAAMLSLAVLAPPAHAVLPSGNVIVNGDAEAGPAAGTSAETQPPPGWDNIPNFTTVFYGAASGFPTPAEAPPGGGANFFAGGPDNGFGTSGAQQGIDLSGAAPEIDQGNVQAILTADLGGFDGQEDNTTVAASLDDGVGQTGTGLFLQPVSAADRGGKTSFVRRQDCRTLPAGVRQALVAVITTLQTPTYNDGYVDNIDLRLTNAPCPTAADAPLDPPVAEPEARVNANAQAKSGRILVKRPGGSEFQELSDSRSIPIGSEIDATKGVVELETAANTSGTSQKGQFYDGSFVLTQTGGARPITDLRMTDRIDKCPGTGKENVRAAARSRRLWGNGRGRYRTRGRYATATVRGTKWSTRDTCTTTTVSVSRGTVVVRDLSKRRNIKLKAPRRYTARARNR